MIAQPITVVTDINHDGILSQVRFFQRNHQAPDLMVDQGNLTVCICDNLAELVVGLLLNPALVLAYVSRLFGPGWFGCQDGFMPPGTPFKSALSVRW